MVKSVSFVNRRQSTIETGTRMAHWMPCLCMWTCAFGICRRSANTHNYIITWVEEKSSHIFLFASAKDAKEKESSKRATSRSIFVWECCITSSFFIIYFFPWSKLFLAFKFWSLEGWRTMDMLEM